VVRLNANFPSSATGWARLGGTLAVGRPYCNRAAQVVLEAHARLQVIIASRPPGDMVSPEPLANVIHGKWDPTSILNSGWRPHKRPVLSTVTEKSTGEAVAHVYTDGSTGRDASLPTGCSVVLALAGDRSAVNGFTSPRGGDNFTAELAALVAALQSVPSHVHLVVHTDSEAVIGAVNKGRLRDWLNGGHLNRYAVSQRRRILSACRPQINCARALIAARAGNVELAKVKAHSGGTDIHARLNEEADGEANRVRIEAINCPFPPRDLAGEVEVGIWLPNKRGPGQGAAVIGSFRQALERRAETIELATLGSHIHQGRLARECGTRLVSALKAVQKSHSAALTMFMLEAVTEYLPVERRMQVKCADAGRGESCKLCGVESETCVHALGGCGHRVPTTRTRVVVADALNIAQAPPSKVGGLGGVKLMAWWDPTREAEVELRIPEGLTVSQLNQVRSHPPLAGFIGIHPPGVDLLLRRPGDDLAATQERAASLSRTLMWGAFLVWSARCRAMNDLLDEHDSLGFGAGLVEQMVVRKHKKLAKTEARQTLRFEAKRSKRRQDAGVAESSREQRPWLAKALSVKFGSWVNTKSSDEERVAQRDDLLRQGVVVFPVF
jgi:ribonuclease HI